MAQQVHAARQYAFRYRSFHIDKNQPLGHGSYGAVYKAKCDQLPCAAKVLHPTILDPRDPGSDRIMQRFQQECAFLSSIRHPYIVQYLGMTRDPESKLPVLLMELLDSSLTHLLENSKGPLAYHIEVDICHDVALAVSYLHSNDIIPRDLSSNNVLIIAGKRAKVTDFGMSKLAGTTQATMTPLTMCPGTLAYMSPEALSEPPKYTKKLDCFSEGVLMVQICTRLWPEPGPRTQKVPFPSSPTGSIEMPVLEIERRKMHIDLIDPNHEFLPIIKESLNYDESKRPSAEELCEMVGTLKQKPSYKRSMNSGQSQPSEQLQRQLSMYKSTSEQQKQEIEKQREEIIGCRQEVEACQQDLQEKDNAIALMENELQRLQEELEIRDQTIAMMQQADSAQQARMRHINSEAIQSQSKNVSSKPTNALSDEKTGVGNGSEDRPTQSKSASYRLPTKKATLTWRKESELPHVMQKGSNTVVHGNMVYFMNKYGGALLSYNFSTEKWKPLPNSNYSNCGLAIIEGQLTTIGGCDWDPNVLYTVFRRKEYKVTKKLLTLQSNKWVECFPPLPIERGDVAAVTTEQYLIVAGGKDKDRRTLNRVDVLNIDTKIWSEVNSLVSRAIVPSTTIIGDQLYVLDGEYSGSLQRCNIKTLIQSKKWTQSVWETLESCPVNDSTCIAINGELLAIGGRSKEKHTLNTDAVHKYDPATNSWSVIMDSMPTARSGCFVIVTPNNELMVVGGQTTSGTNNYARCRAVEIAKY